MLRCLEPENCSIDRDTIQEKRAQKKICDILSCENILKQVKTIASSRTAGIWRIKRAKIILGALDNKSVERMVLDLRVPPTSIIKAMEDFTEKGLQYFKTPGRKPTQREACVEKLLKVLQNPCKKGSDTWDSTRAKYIGHYFTANQVKKIRNLIKSNPEYTRNRIAKHVCLAFNFYQSDGNLKLNQVAHILKRMDMDNLIFLPPAKKSTKKTNPDKKKKQPLKIDTTSVTLSREEMKELKFIPAYTAQNLLLWRELIEQYHYIGGSTLFGAQMRYLVYAGKKKILVAVIGFAAGSWSLAGRDRFIGWTREQRDANLKYVVNNVRFLILPWVRVPNLASRILGGIAKQLPVDWENRYKYRPVLLETFVQLNRFKGTCYRAANWTQLGKTSGYSLYPSHRLKKQTKGIFIYPLCKNFRKKLCSCIMDS
ncbi:MAG: hypothetical protein B6I22_00160 [Desulfobacteraceae bacterium 4572_123]|nr:MAG: hypothetical protein B6I22_00160 [Desulfobacteraceae bacterium 4572_123]